jgi:hypothetical protein
MKGGISQSFPLWKRGIKGDFKKEDKSSPTLLYERRE